MIMMKLSHLTDPNDLIVMMMDLMMVLKLTSIQVIPYSRYQWRWFSDGFIVGEG